MPACRSGGASSCSPAPPRSRPQRHRPMRSRRAAPRPRARRTRRTRPAPRSTRCRPPASASPSTARRTTLTLDTRTTLLDALREHLHLTGTQEGLRPRPVRRLHGDRRRPAHHLLPDARRDARRRPGHDHRGPGHARADCIRCRRPSSSTTATSAATARPGRSARRSAMLDEIDARHSEPRHRRPHRAAACSRPPSCASA